MSQSSFDDLLDWLAEDRDEAARLYNDIHRRLVRMFMHRGSCRAEDLADETLDRVSRKVPEIRDNYTGNKFHYIHRVAHFVELEDYKKRHAEPLPEVLVSPASEEDEESARAYACLDACMEKLAPETRGLVLEYLKDDKRAKIDHRKELAVRLGVSLNALRIRLHRICAGLKACMNECVKQGT